MLLDTYALSIAGRRANNEDAICAQPEIGLFVIADGMGGYEGGQEASRIAIETIEHVYAETTEGDPHTWLDQGFQDVGRRTGSLSHE